ncbi:MAG: acetyl-CoA carboxylase biotin carboxylase subunit [Acidobacteriota bacterium]
MFSKILIANRGEIAVRVIRACRELGISPVAVYSEADRAALHVRLADEAYYLGAAPSLESYLSSERILDAIARAGVQAVHPGYGFLSENAAFAQAVESAGVTFIGPSSRSMELMGGKIDARQLAQQAEAPIVPGTNAPLASAEEALATAEKIGFPVMLKAAAGGGGKGLRLVRNREALLSAYNLARSEAAAAFKDATVYLEKFIEHPRHIEIQIFGDRQGNYVYLGERECSIQRRNQKVIEECPSPLNNPDLRRRMGEAAVRIARTAGYYNAGTVEFLVDRELNFYFLEMNTRLQVEHPVTELVTGIDLVKEQIRVAAGEPLSFTQADITLRGAAIECRIYAEDADHNFMPNPGTITRLRVPGGPGVRLDSGVYEGYEVPIYYDPLLAKLIVWGATREEAIARLWRALDEYNIEGIKTTIPFFKSLIKLTPFLNGDLDTGFIERNWRPQAMAQPDHEHKTTLDLAALVVTLHHTRTKTAAATNANHNSAGFSEPSAWKLSGRAQQHRKGDF